MHGTIGTNPTVGPVGGRVPLVDEARLPLAFIGVGLLALAVAAGWTAVVFARPTPPTFHPEVVALAHVWLPGFLLSICLGACYQLMPVVLGVPLRAGMRSLWSHLALHLGGIVLLAIGFASGRYALAGIGGSAITIGAMRFASVTLATFRTSPRRDAAAWSFPLATGWLLATVAAGVLLALNRGAPFLPWSALALLKAHAHLGLAGFFLSLLQGVTFQLVPMFTMGKASRPRLALAGLVSTQCGLPVLAAGMATDVSMLARLGGGILLVGMVMSGIGVYDTLRTRKRRRLDPAVKAFVIGLVVLSVAAGIGAGLLSGWIPSTLSNAGAWVYGVATIGGGLSLAVLGMLGKILPFLVWMKAYGPRVGREPVPVATALASRTLERFWLVGHLGAIGLLIWGALAGSVQLAASGGSALALAMVCYLGNAVRVLRHLWKPERTVSRPPARPFSLL